VRWEPLWQSWPAARNACAFRPSTPALVASWMHARHSRRSAVQAPSGGPAPAASGPFTMHCRAGAGWRWPWTSGSAMRRMARGSARSRCMPGRLLPRARLPTARAALRRARARRRPSPGRPPSARCRPARVSPGGLQTLRSVPRVATGHVQEADWALERHSLERHWSPAVPGASRAR